MKYIQLLIVVISLTIFGTGIAKPGNNDLKKLFNQTYSAYKEIGFDFSQYIRTSEFKVTSSYRDGSYYVLNAIPTIEIIKDIDVETIKSIEEKAGENSAYIFITISLYESLKKYRSGKIDTETFRLDMIKSSLGMKPEGILKSGDKFDSLENEFKFRETDQGWIAVKRK